MGNTTQTEYLTGLDGTDDCPPITRLVRSGQECRLATSALSLRWAQELRTSYYPQGCFVYGGSVLFNDYPDAPAKPGYSPVCMTIPEPAPMPTPAPSPSRRPRRRLRRCPC